MELRRYKSFCTCPSCGRTIPRNREFFRRNGRDFHSECKQCEDVFKGMAEWKNGLLLCHSCHEYKPEDEFTPNNTKNEVRNYRRHICNGCNTARQRLHDISLPDDKKLIKCLRWRFLGARDRAGKSGVPFSITLEDVIALWRNQNGLCALSGIPMTFELKKGRVPTNVSIDRIDGQYGYVNGNIRLVCNACNQIKSDMSEDKMYWFCKKIVDYYENKNSKVAR